MESLKGPNIDIILSLNEGYDFSFISTKFRIVASLNSYKIETNEFNGDQVIGFNSELAWASDKNNIKKLKNYKVPIRLDFIKVGENNSLKPFGYVILSLKSAQYISKEGNSTIKDERVKVCGLGIEAKGCCPELTFSLRFQDITPNDLVSARDNGNEIAVTARASESSPNLESAINKKYVNIDAIIAPEQTILEDVKKLESCSKYELYLNFVRINWISHYKDVHFRIHNSKAEVLWSAHEEISETIPGTSTNLENVTGRVVFVVTPSEIMKVISDSPPNVTICTNRQGRPHVLAKAILVCAKLNEGVSEYTTDFHSIVTEEKSAVLVYTTELIEIGPHTHRTPLFEDENPLLDRMIDELESWKEKERKKLNEEFENKLKEEIIKAISTNKKQEMENNSSDKICEKLNLQLQKAISDVRQKEKYLEMTRTELETNYRKLTEETKIETESLRKTLHENVKEKDKTIYTLQHELKNLKRDIQEKEIKEIHDAEKIENLVANLEKMSEQLDRMKSSKSFFQEQWSRAVRELHRIKCEGWNDIQVQLNFRKEELKRLGLDELISDTNSNQSADFIEK